MKRWLWFKWKNGWFRKFFKGAECKEGEETPHQIQKSRYQCRCQCWCRCPQHQKQCSSIQQKGSGFVDENEGAWPVHHWSPQSSTRNLPSSAPTGALASKSTSIPRARSICGTATIPMRNINLIVRRSPCCSPSPCHSPSPSWNR